MKIFFVGKPNMLVKDRHRRPLFRFDENGIYGTEDRDLIAKLKKRFKIKEDEYSKMKRKKLEKVAKEMKIEFSKDLTDDELRSRIRDVVYDVINVEELMK